MQAQAYQSVNCSLFCAHLFELRRRTLVLLRLVERGKVIQVEDVEDRAHSSERRDCVPSLRENKVPLDKLAKTEGIMKEIPFMSRIKNKEALG